MKRFQGYIILQALLMILFAGCREVNIETVLQRDGSIIRTIETQGGKTSELFELGLPVDSTWNLSERTEISEDDTLHYQVATRKFESLKEMNQVFGCDSDSLTRLRFCAALEQDFRWFHSFWTYTETYQPYFPYQKISAEEFLTPNELQVYANADSTPEPVDSRVERFFEKAMFSEMYQPILDTLRSMDKPVIAIDSLMYYRDSLEISIFNLESESDSAIIQDIMATMSDILADTDIYRFESLITRQYNQILNKEGFLFSVPEEWKHKIQMPGVIITTSADSLINPSAAYWQFESRKFQFTEHSMTVTSRVMNVWAILVTAIVVIMLILGIVYSYFRKPDVSVSGEGPVNMTE